MSNLCRNCDQTFYSVGAFDMHRTGDYGKAIYQQVANGKQGKVIGHEKPTRRCLSVEEMETLGMKRNTQGKWTSGKENTFRSALAKERAEF